MGPQSPESNENTRELEFAKKTIEEFITDRDMKLTMEMQLSAPREGKDDVDQALLDLNRQRTLTALQDEFWEFRTKYQEGGVTGVAPLLEDAISLTLSDLPKESKEAKGEKSMRGQTLLRRAAGLAVGHMLSGINLDDTRTLFEGITSKATHLGYNVESLGIPKAFIPKPNS